MQGSSTMKAWIVPKPGIENAVLKDDVNRPEIKQDYQIIVKVLAVGLNPVDYKWAARSDLSVYPFIPGIDCAGIVEQIGSKVDSSKFKEKETFVMVPGSLMNEQGGYFAEYVVHDSRYVCVVPPALYEKRDIKDVACDIAALPVAALTAYQAIFDRLRLPLYKQERISNFKSVRSIVVTAGAGGVGSFCLQFLKLWTETLDEDERKLVKIIATCSSSNFDYCKRLGATHVIDYTKENVKDRVFEINNNEGVDAWIENVSGESGALGLECLAFAGELVSIAAHGIKGELKSLDNEAKTAHFLLLGWAYKSKLHEKILEITRMGEKTLELLARGKIESCLSETIKFEQVREYLEKLRERHVKGKVVAKLD